MLRKVRSLAGTIFGLGADMYTALETLERLASNDQLAEIGSVSSFSFITAHLTNIKAVLQRALAAISDVYASVWWWGL